MGLFNRKEKSYAIVLPSGKTINISGSPEALDEFVEYMKITAMLTQGLAPESDCEHQWLEGLVCYQLFHSEPKRYQLMCSECGMWIDVDEREWQRHLTKELHREHVEQEQAAKDADAMQDMVEALYGIENE